MGAHTIWRLMDLNKASNNLDGLLSFSYMYAYSMGGGGGVDEVAPGAGGASVFGGAAMVAV